MCFVWAILSVVLITKLLPIFVRFTECPVFKFDHVIPSNVIGFLQALAHIVRHFFTRFIHCVTRTVAIPFHLSSQIAITWRFCHSCSPSFNRFLSFLICSSCCNNFRTASNIIEFAQHQYPYSWQLLLYGHECFGQLSFFSFDAILKHSRAFAMVLALRNLRLCFTLRHRPYQSFRPLKTNTP